MQGRGAWGWVMGLVMATGCATVGVGRFPAEQISVPAAAEHYSTSAQPDGVIGGRLHGTDERDIRQALVERGARPESDGSLASAACWALNEVHRGRAPTPGNLEAAIRHFGFAGRGSGTSIFAAGHDDWREVFEQLPSNLQVNRYGLCYSPSGRSVALMLGAMEASFQSIARFYEPNSTVTLQGEIDGRYKTSHLYLTRPPGKVEEKLLSSRRVDSTFDLTEPGQYQLEVMGDGASGPVIIFNVPLYVGVSEPPIAGVAGTAVGAAEAERRLFELLNDERRRAGLSPVARDDELRELALAHSEDMADHDFFAHVSPSSGSPEARAKRSGILVVEFGENISQADTPETAHDGLLNSPGHRAIMLKPAFTHVGIGVVEKGSALIATFNFGRRVPVANLPASATQVEAAIVALRANKGLRAARVDAVYRAGAYAGASEAASGAAPGAVTGAIDAAMKREVDRLRQGRPAACITLFELLELSQLEQLPALSSPQLRSYGVGAKLRTDKHGTRLSTVIIHEGAPCN